MDKRIELCIGTNRAGDIRIRLSLLTVSGASIIHEHYHSSNLQAGDDQAELRTRLEAHLAMPESANEIPGAPWGPIPDAEWAKVLAVIPVFHTAEAIAKRKKVIEFMGGKFDVTIKDGQPVVVN